MDIGLDCRDAFLAMLSPKVVDQQHIARKVASLKYTESMIIAFRPEIFLN